MDIRKLIIENVPVLLTSAAVAGVLSTTVLAVKATPNAARDIMDAESEHDRPITSVEKLRLTWHYYIPSAIVGGVTVAAIIGAHGVNTKKQATIAGLYTLTDRAYTEFRDKVEEKIGEKKTKEIRDEVIQERVTKDAEKPSQIIIFDEAKVLCYDAYHGNYFESTKELLMRAQNAVNEECLNNNYASQNDFHRIVGIPSTPMGEEVGWRTDNLMKLDFSSGVTEDGRPYLAFDYHMHPIRNYYKGY